MSRAREGSSRGLVEGEIRGVSRSERAGRRGAEIGASSYSATVEKARVDNGLLYSESMLHLHDDQHKSQTRNETLPTDYQAWRLTDSTPLIGRIRHCNRALLGILSASVP